MAWNGSAFNRETAQRPPSRKAKRITPASKTILFLALVFAAVGCVIFFLSRNDHLGDDVKPSRPEKASSRRVDVVRREVPPSSAQDRQADQDDVNPVWANAKGLDPALFPYKDGRKVIETRTNEWLAIDICIMPNGVRRKVRRNVSKQLFGHSTDQIIMQALSTGGDEVGPPIPFSEDMEEDFLESLKTPIVIDEDDTPEQRAVKEAVIAAREAIAEQIKEGRSFYDAITDHIAAQAANQNARETVMAAVEELKAGGEGDLVNDYLAESNKILEGMGASPILLSDVEEDDEGQDVESQQRKED